ncbi:MAG: ABC transporter substrate-binding protein [Chloroflexi bacterium]|nr:ABC transporter substrate-binding protein [Chloroflexota bacterium]
MAKAKNYFVEEGLDIEWVVTGSGAKALAAAVGQSAHLTTAATPEVLSAIAQGQPVQTVGIVTVGESTGIVMRKEVADRKKIGPQTSLAERVNALKGLKISASSPGSGTDNALRYVLTKFNVDPDRDVEVTYMGLPASLQALEAGAVEAMVNSEVRFSQAVVAGFGIDLLVLGRDLPETRQNAYGTITFPKNVLVSQPDIPEAFVRATWRGMRLLKENRLDAEEAFRKDSFPDLDPVVFNATFDASYWRFPDSPAVTREQFQAALEYRNRTSKEEPLRVTYEEFYTPKFVEAAKKQLGF